MAMLVGLKGTMPLSYEQQRRGLDPSAVSDVVLTCALLSSSGLVTGSQEGMVYLWDEERRETVQRESIQGHTGAVLHLARWKDYGMVSVGQDGGVVLWTCGKRASFEKSYSHISKFYKVYVNGETS